jgi:hypothetical protein
MSTSNKRRQKQLEKKAAKRKEKKHSHLRKQSAPPVERFAAMARHPILDCIISANIEEEGIGWVTLSRETPNALVAVASFLVDTYCLGVKNLNADIMSRPTYIRDYRKKLAQNSPSRNISPAEARKFLESAVAYARGIGFEPYPDYEAAMLLFGDINPLESDAQFTFGQNGKPYFMAGPFDSRSRCQQIVDTLTKTCGAGQFHFTVPVFGSDELILLDEVDDDLGDSEEDGEDREAMDSEWRPAIGDR